jgi:glutathione peroxidase
MQKLPEMTAAQNIYGFELKTLTGKPFDTANLQGKVCLIVNTASKCGYTRQLAGLEELHQEFGQKGLVILGFPCNQFGGQDPGSADEIGEFCTKNYSVQFQMMEKIEVNGDNEHPLYNYLKHEKPGIMGLKLIKWNFEKVD